MLVSELPACSYLLTFPSGFNQPYVLPYKKTRQENSLRQENIFSYVHTLHSRFRLVFLAVGTIIALQFSESVFLRGINGAGELLYEIDHQPVCKFTYKQTDELLHRSRVERLLIPVFLFETVFHKAQRVFLYI